MGVSDSVERYWSVKSRVTATQYSYDDPRERISRGRRCFFAWKTGFSLGLTERVTPRFHRDGFTRGRLGFPSDSDPFIRPTGHLRANSEHGKIDLL